MDPLRGLVWSASGMVAGFVDSPADRLRELCTGNVPIIDKAAFRFFTGRASR